MVAEDSTYICEECRSKSDRVKICCGKKMTDSKYVTKTASTMCGCGCLKD
ncbi:MAG: hypothetical protein ABIB47_04315 [Candidatus Woesearchaeota archaeon]